MEETQTVAADDVTVTTAAAATAVTDQLMSDEDGDNTIISALGVDNTTLYDHGDQ